MNYHKVRIAYYRKRDVSDYYNDLKEKGGHCHDNAGTICGENIQLNRLIKKWLRYRKKSRKDTEE